MDGYNAVSLMGIPVLLALAWVLAGGRRRFPVKTVIAGLALQGILGFLIFVVPAGAWFFQFLNDAFLKVLDAAREGVTFCFGPLADPAKTNGFVLLIHALMTIVFFAALMELLYHWRVMPLLIKGFSRLFTRCMNVSGAESLCAASNIFVGIESAAAIRPYLARMTRSELCTILTAGMATIASTVLGAYTGILQAHFPTIAAHLISASLLSAPAALIMSKLILPEREKPETLGLHVEPHFEQHPNFMVAIIQGATMGGKLLMGVLVMLLALVSLVKLVNLGLAFLCGIGTDIVEYLVCSGCYRTMDNLAASWAGAMPRALAQALYDAIPGARFMLTLEQALAVVFYPFSLLLGVPPTDAWQVALLLGKRVVLTEFQAYVDLAGLLGSQAFSHPRSAVIAGYALCGFAHFPSVAIFLGGIAALAPKRTNDLSRVALRALIAATLACFMTAALAGAFYNGQGLFL